MGRINVCTPLAGKSAKVPLLIGLREFYILYTSTMNSEITVPSGHGNTKTIILTQIVPI
jgi:hypothetical protein